MKAKDKRKKDGLKRKRKESDSNKVEISTPKRQNVTSTLAKTEEDREEVSKSK